MFSWYRIRNIGQLFVLVHVIYLILLEEHLYQEHHPSEGDLVLPLRVSCSPDTKYENSTWYTCVKISWTTSVSRAPPNGDVVLAPRVSCSPGRKYGNSAIYFCSFVRYSCPKTFWKDSVSRSRSFGGRFRATSSSVMLSWYRIRNVGQLFLVVYETWITWRTFVSGAPPIRGRSRATASSVIFFSYWMQNIGQLFLLVHDIYLFKDYSKNICIRSTTHRRAISCHLFECHVLLIRNTKFQPDILVSKFLVLPLSHRRAMSC